MSPTLLSKRLRELEEAGIVNAVPLSPGGPQEYRLTPAGEELRPLVVGLGEWGYRWVEASLSLSKLDPTLLMWDIRRRMDASAFPRRRSTVQFAYPELDVRHRDYWLVVEDGKADLCYVDPGYEVDLWVRCPLRVMTAIWMGYTSLRAEIAKGAVEVDGDAALARSMPVWLRSSSFAPAAELSAG
jgi:hypothetical protein